MAAKATTNGFRVDAEIYGDDRRGCSGPVVVGCALKVLDRQLPLVDATGDSSPFEEVGNGPAVKANLPTQFGQRLAISVPGYQSVYL